MKKVSLVVVTDSDDMAHLLMEAMRVSGIDQSGLLTLKYGEIEDLTNEEEQEVTAKLIEEGYFDEHVYVPESGSEV